MRAELTIEIARTPEDVFAYLTDVANLPEWQSGVRAAARSGDRIEETRSFLGREMHTTLEILESEPPRVFTLKALDGPVRFTVTHELEPAGRRDAAHRRRRGRRARLRERHRRAAGEAAVLEGLRAPEGDPRELGARA